MISVAATALLALLLGWALGGQALLGRIDPALVFPWLFVPLFLLACRERKSGRRRRWRMLLLAIAVLLAGQALLAFTLAGRTDWLQPGLQLGLVAVGAVFAALLADWLAQKGHSRWRWAGGALLSLVWLIAGQALLALLYAPLPPSTTAPPMTMATALPLRWAGGDGDLADMLRTGAADAPALARLEKWGPVRLVDNLANLSPPGSLLLAHPRALAPDELVAVDAFVRGGGRAVILADALSSWPPRHPLGNPRNPPVTSLLTPLLDHWQIELGAAPQGEGERKADANERRLRLFSAGGFTNFPSACRSYAERRILHCSIGRGEAWLVGDADLLFAPLWQPLVPGAAHLRRADTMEWLAALLWGEAAARAPLTPLWISARSS
ncbi:hypothetical protein [Sphingopyxis sp. MWB1]|uniref:hypothetical protein n=1 Tax=Sphingopyxis sp. MWB1 TaxID=1537715 RepID=UPI00051A0EAB|nr:hypothetical protein [Sphingopyxis sp. MWB1]